MNQKFKKFLFWGGMVLAAVAIVTALVIGITNRIGEFQKDPTEESKPVVEELPDGYVKTSKVSWDNSAAFNSTDLDKITTIEFVNKYDGDAEDAWTFDGIQLYQNEGVVYVRIPNNLKILGTMHGAFSNMKNLVEIKGLDLVDTSSVQDMGKLFSGCVNLEIVDLSQLETDALVNGEYMFEGCTNLRAIDLSKNKMDNLATAAYMFVDCNRAESVTLPNTPVLANVTHMFDNAGSGTTNGVTIGGDFNISQCKDLSYMFARAYLGGMDFVQSMNVAAVKDMTGMFEGSPIEHIDLSKWDVSSVEKMDSMFSECTLLMDVNVSNWKVPSLKSCSNMFYNCYQMTSLSINWIGVDIIDNASAMFRECTHIVELDISGFDGKTIGDARFMFSNCLELKKIISNGFDANVSDGMFAWCESLPNYDEQIDTLNDTSKELYFTKK